MVGRLRLPLSVALGGISLWWFRSSPVAVRGEKGVTQGVKVYLCHLAPCLLCGAGIWLLQGRRANPRRVGVLRSAGFAGGCCWMDSWVVDEAAVAEDRYGLLQKSGAGPDIAGDLYRMDHICF